MTKKISALRNQQSKKVIVQNMNLEYTLYRIEKKRSYATSLLCGKRTKGQQDEFHPNPFFRRLFILKY